MIQFITGVVGSGKTLHAVRLGVDSLKRGQTIVTNVELYPDKIIELVARKFGLLIGRDQIRVFNPDENPNWETLIPWGDKSCPVLVILDEAQLFYNARDWAKTAERSKRLLAFLTQSRKAGVDVIWITQEGENVDKQFRVLAEWELAISSTDHLPLGFIGKLPFRAYVVKHVSAKGRYVVRKKWWGYDRWLFGLYKTESFLNSEMREMAQGVERVGRKRVIKIRVWRRLGMWIAYFVRKIKRIEA